MRLNLGSFYFFPHRVIYYERGLEVWRSPRAFWSLNTTLTALTHILTRNPSDLVAWRRS